MRKRKKTKKSKHVYNNTYKFINELVKTYSANILFHRINDWCNQFSRIRNRNKLTKKQLRLIRSKKLLIAYYCDKVWDIEEYIKMVTKGLANTRYLALNERLPQKNKYEFQLDYVEWIVPLLKEGAFRDRFVIDTLAQLRKNIYIGKLPLEKRRKYAEKLNHIFEGLKLDVKLAGKKEDVSNDMVKIYPILKQKLKEIKRCRSRDVFKSELRKTFPPATEEDIDTITRLLHSSPELSSNAALFEMSSDEYAMLRRPKNAECAKYILARAYKLSPRTVQDKLSKARNFSQ